jgi:peptidoglycan/LPS O-acetylase OafA/YrhL
MVKQPARADPSRRADVDILRASAVGLVLVVHTAQVFSPWQTWHVQNAERSRVLAELMLFAGPWLMALFMLLAGRSAFHSLAHRDNRSYLKERVLRILVPLVAGTLLLGPPQMYVRRVHENRFDASFLEFLPHFFNGLPPEGNFSWGHLWFLAYLFLYATLGLPVLRWLHPRLVARTWARCNAVSLCAVFILMAVALQVALRAPFPQTNALFDDWANHAQLFPAFLFGYAFAADQRLREWLVRGRYLSLGAGLVASGAIAVFAWSGNFSDRLPQQYSIAYAVFWSGAAIATWAWLFAITAWASLRLQRPFRVLAWTRQIVYAFYILHQPILVFTAWWVVQSTMAIAAEFAVLLALSFAATIAACEVVRRIRLGRWLLGIKPQTGA